MCLHVCLCVRSINISTLPSSRCLYDTAVLLSSCLSLYLPDCFIELHSDTIYEGEAGGEDVFPKLQQKTSLSVSPSPLVIWALIYVLLWQKIDELPGWEHARRHSGGKQQKAGFTEQMSTMKGSMCAPLPSPPLLSPPLPSPTSPELSDLSPHRYFPPSIHPSPPLPSTPPPPPTCISSVMGMTSKVVPECWGPEGTPLLSMQVRSCERTCAGSERGAQCLL